MNSEQVIIDDDNDSIDTVVILDEDTVTNSQNKPSRVNLYEEKSRRSETSHDVMEIDICNRKDNGKSRESFSNIIRETVDILNGGDTINLDKEISRSETSNNTSEDSFANLLRNNRLISKLVRKCLNLENSEGMTRIINKTMLPMYRDTDSSFKASAHLRRVLKTTLKQMELDPSHKFSHIKSLCDMLKSKKYRKKVPFLTLSTDLKKREEQECPENDNTSHIFRGTQRNEIQTDVTNLVNSQKDIINLDNNEEDNDVIILDGPEVIGSETPRSDNSNKENNRLTYTVDPGRVSVIELDKEIPNTSTHNEKNNLLLPHRHKYVNDESTVLRKVQEIETKIAHYKSIIAKLEETEVLDYYSCTSPYVQCDGYKAKIVNLYKEICRLTGAQSVKRREVRLRVTLGHSPGPVKRLEKFLNWNIDSTGTPPFPDFHDVLNCVQKANTEDNLGWTKAQVMKEASSLFTQCGHALRKRRQKREWRDLLSFVKEELPDADPADESPQLSAKLEQNKRVAQAKEHQIFERFAQMENQPRVSSPLNPRLSNIDIIQDADTSDSETEHNESARNGVNNCDSFLTNVDKDTKINIDQEVNMSFNVNIGTNIDNQSLRTDVGSESPVQIKQEPVDIQSKLDGLGSDYTVTVFDIEDPFLVIEISSDSSYSDDDNL